MKIKELNRRIFHEVSEVTDTDHIDSLSACYELVRSTGAERIKQMDVCMQKWNRAFQFVDSEDLLQSYTAFFRRVSA